MSSLLSSCHRESYDYCHFLFHSIFYLKIYLSFSYNSVSNGPLVATEVAQTQSVPEPTITQAQQPPDVNSESSQSSMTNGLTGTESGQDSDSGYVNSPKKVMPDTPEAANFATANVANGNVQVSVSYFSSLKNSRKLLFS